MELSAGRLLLRRFLRSQTYWQVGHEAVDRAIGWRFVSRQVTARAESQGDAFFVVQVGANDGLRDDPIHRYIVNYGWGGLLVEPVPRYSLALQRTYANQRGLHFAQVAVSEYDGVATMFAVNPDNDQDSRIYGCSSLRREVIDRSAWTVRDAESQVVPISVCTRRLEGLLGDFSVSHIDYLVVDTEGHDGVVVNQALRLPPEQIPPMILYEHNHLPHDERLELEGNLHDAGYGIRHMRRDTFAWQLSSPR